jgi:hypothetical protein
MLTCEKVKIRGEKDCSAKVLKPIRYSDSDEIWHTCSIIYGTFLNSFESY